jgi:uncharacterized MAPEG superfamily protein
MYLHSALVTLLSMILLMFAMGLVGRARGRHGIHPPATTGHPDFERAFRAHMNTVEQLVVFLPLLWLATIHFNPQYAAWAGYAWVAGRLYYIIGYAQSVEARSKGFLIGALATIGLLVMAAWGIGRGFLAG